MPTKKPATAANASSQITKKIAAQKDWRGNTLARMRQLIHEALPDVQETLKWRETPVWEHEGILCTGETYKGVVKLTFAKGAALKDPKGLFNSSLEGNTRRAIDIREGETVNATAFKTLIRAAAAANAAGKKPAAKTPAIAPAKAPAKAVAALCKGPPVKPAKSGRGASLQPGTAQYNDALAPDDKAIADLLARTIDRILPEAENKIWHAIPVWFLEGNPVAGYGKLKNCVRLLFWSGQSFDEPGLSVEGSFKAADVRYTSADQINVKDLERWLKKSRDIQWDYKNLVKRRGRLERLK